MKLVTRSAETADSDALCCSRANSEMSLRTLWTHIELTVMSYLYK